MSNKRSNSYYQEDVSVLRDFAVPLNKRVKDNVDQVEAYNPQQSTGLKHFMSEDSLGQNLNSNNVW